jgi:hypothetical protein
MPLLAINADDGSRGPQEAVFLEHKSYLFARKTREETGWAPRDGTISVIAREGSIRSNAI